MKLFCCIILGAFMVMSASCSHNSKETRRMQTVKINRENIFIFLLIFQKFRKFRKICGISSIISIHTEAWYVNIEKSCFKKSLILSV